MRGREPDADQRRNRYNGQERVRQHQQHRMDARCIRNRWRRPGIRVAPDRRAETKHTEQYERARSYDDQPFGQNTRHQRLCADAARHGHETCTHPSGVSAADIVRSAASSVRRSALSSTRAVLRSIWAALSFMWTALALSFSLVSTTFGLAILEKYGGLRKFRRSRVPVQLPLDQLVRSARGVTAEERLRCT